MARRVTTTPNCVQAGTRTSMAGHGSGPGRAKGRIHRALIGVRSNPLTRRSPVAFQQVWMLAPSAGALALGLVPLYGAFVAAITVAVATDGEIVPERNALD